MIFPPRFLEELRDRVPVSAVVGRRVKLQRRGREHVGLCPFHHEKTPSFTVSDDKGFYHCFGCGAHGDAVSFAMQTEGLSFVEAVERLAAEAGLEVPRPSREEQERERRAADLHEVLEAACAFFEKQLRLPEGRAALDYLRGRGLDDAAIARHRLGFAPDRRGALAAALGREGATPERLVEAGLLKRREEDGSVVEYFRGRVIFPIADRRGRVVAFGGRALGEAQPKYLNSPETAVFHKGRMLYNHARAREAARERGAVIVAEGYMDVIALDRAGFPHAVAPLGTALTEEQIQELWRMAPEPILCLDGDAAGQRAALRAADRALPLLQPGLSLRFAMLPAGLDPDDLIGAEGAAAMEGVLAASRPLADLLWEAEQARQTLDTPERRAALQQRLSELAKRIQDPVVRDYYFNDFRARLAALFPPPARPERRRGGERRPEAPAGPAGPRNLTAMQDLRERQLRLGQHQVLATLLCFPELLHEFGEFLSGLELGGGELDRLRLEILSLSASGAELDEESLVSHLSRAGFAASLRLLRSRRVDGVAWRRFSDAEQARASLAHIATQMQHRLIESDVRAKVDRIDDSATAQMMDAVAAVAALERSRALESGET